MMMLCHLGFLVSLVGSRAISPVRTRMLPQSQRNVVAETLLVATENWSESSHGRYTSAVHELMAGRLSDYQLQQGVYLSQVLPAGRYGGMRGPPDLRQPPALSNWRRSHNLPPPGSP